MCNGERGNCDEVQDLICCKPIAGEYDKCSKVPSGACKQEEKCKGDTDYTYGQRDCASGEVCCIKTGEEWVQYAVGSAAGAAADKAVAEGFKLLKKEGEKAVAGAQKEKLNYKQEMQSKFGPWAKVDLLVWIWSGAFGWGLAESTSGAGTCFPEGKLDGTEHCEECNRDAYTLCTKERCEMLGTCLYQELPSDDPRGGLCFKGECEPTAIPGINSITTEFLVDHTETLYAQDGEGKSIVINPPASGEASQGQLRYKVSDVLIGITLNQPSKCKWTYDKGKSYDDIPAENEFEGGWNTEKTVVIPFNNLKKSFANAVENKIFIKCKGTCDQATEAGDDNNFIKFTIAKKPDEEPPRITRIFPDPRGYISNEQTEAVIEVWLDENAYCKYSSPAKNLTTDWENMSMFDAISDVKIKGGNCSIGNMQCCEATDDLDGQCYTDAGSYKCSHCFLRIDATTGYDTIEWSETQGLTNEMAAQYPEFAEKFSSDTYSKMSELGLEGTTKLFNFMFRCADRGRENKMAEEDSYLYVLGTISPFKMEILKPIENKGKELPIEIEVNTSRGTVCKYSVNEDLKWEDENKKIVGSDSAWIKEHNDEIDALESSAEGTEHTLYVECRDMAGLSMKDSIKFKVLKDVAPPELTRVYYQNNFLYIKTNEKAICTFTTKSCDYDFAEQFKLYPMYPSILSETNYYDWVDAWTYYIKCKDKEGNMPSRAGCTAIIHPYSVGA
jgi:hypothetical protein